VTDPEKYPARGKERNDLPPYQQIKKEPPTQEAFFRWANLRPIFLTQAAKIKTSPPDEKNYTFFFRDRKF
jgi:hypothetical protein